MSRLKLHEILVDILGSRHVYFQPPENIRLTYPCIVYERSSIDTNFADNNPYTNKKRYTVTVIDKNPDSVIPDKVAAVPMCGFGKSNSRTLCDSVYLRFDGRSKRNGN